MLRPYTYSGSSSHIRGRCWEENPIRLGTYISCQSYLIFLRKAIYFTVQKYTITLKIFRKLTQWNCQKNNF